MFLNKNVVNKVTCFLVMGLMCSGLFINTCIGMDTVPSSESSSHNSSEGKAPINFREKPSEDFRNLGLEERLAKDAKRTLEIKKDIERKTFVFDMIKMHASKYPLLFSEEGLNQTKSFISKLTHMSSQNFLLREDGLNEMNKKFLIEIQKIDFDYTYIYLIKRLNDIDLSAFSNFYEIGKKDMFQSQLDHCFQQRSALLIVLKEMKFFSDKLIESFASTTDSSLTESIKNLEHGFNCFKDISGHYEFISLCLNERKDFMIVLNDFNDFMTTGGTTPYEFLFDIDYKLMCEAWKCKVIVEERRLIKSAEYAKKAVDGEKLKVSNPESEKNSEPPRKTSSKEKRKSLVKRVSKNMLQRKPQQDAKQDTNTKDKKVASPRENKQGSPEGNRKFEKKSSQDLGGNNQKSPEKDVKKKDKKSDNN